MFTKLHDRRIPNVGVGDRVGVGPVEFQLQQTDGQSDARPTAVTSPPTRSVMTEIYSL